MSSALTSGSIFAGRYRVERRIAKGAMGAVYEAVHLETERRRALKVMHAHILQSEDSEGLRERFKREAKVAAYVESEFIVDVFDAGVDENGRPFLVMELLRGEELGKRVKRLGRLELTDVITYLHQTALALDKTHRAAIIHRDIKPGNLFFTEREDGKPWIKVLDFGVAKVMAESTAGATQAIGTPLYMAPEQFNPHALLTGAVDIYALGMVAYTLLVGHAYRSREAREGGMFALARLAEHGIQEPASTRAQALAVTLPEGFDAWFSRCTALDPIARFETATDAVRALAEATGNPALLPSSRRPSAQTARAFARVGEDANKAELPSGLPPSSSPPPSSGVPSSRRALPAVGSTVPSATRIAQTSLLERTIAGRGKSVMGVFVLIGLGMVIGLGASTLRSREGESARSARDAARALASTANDAKVTSLGSPPSSAAVSPVEPVAAASASDSGGPSVTPGARLTVAGEASSGKAPRASTPGGSAATSAPAKAPPGVSAKAPSTASKGQGAQPKPAVGELPPSKKYTRD